MAIQFNKEEAERALDEISVTHERFLELLNDQMAWIEKCLKDPHESWMPHLWVFGIKPEKNNESFNVIHAIAAPFNEHEEKHAIMSQLGQNMFKEQVVPQMLVMSTEAWHSRRAKDAPHIEPRHDPNRDEAITVWGETLGGRYAAMTNMIITRDPENRIVPGKFEEIIENGKDGATVKVGIARPFWLGYIHACIAAGPKRT